MRGTEAHTSDIHESHASTERFTLTMDCITCIYLGRKEAIHATCIVKAIHYAYQGKALCLRATVLNSHSTTSHHNNITVQIFVVYTFSSVPYDDEN